MSEVTVQFLGAGDAFGSGGRMQTCIFVKGQTQLLIDCGASSLIPINRYQVDTNQISTIFLSHLHGDHAGGIPFFILDAQLNRKRTEPLTIVGPRGAAEWYPRVMEALFPGSFQVERKFPVVIKELDAGHSDVINGITVEAFTVSHGETLNSLALRLTVDGKIITYSGDTQWTDTLLDAGAGADLFIVEAYFFDKKVRNHLDYRTIKEREHELQSRRTILTHMNNDMLAHLTAIDYETAEEGKIIEL